MNVGSASSQKIEFQIIAPLVLLYSENLFAGIIKIKGIIRHNKALYIFVIPT